MRIYAILLPLTVVAAVACGGGTSSGTGPGAVSSVDSSKAINGLSDAEAEQYCKDGNAYYKAQFDTADLKKISCGYSAQILGGFGAKTDAEAQAKCRDQLTKCESKPDNESAGSDAGASESDDCESFKAKSKGCSATVGEYNQCLSDTAAALKALASKDYCAEAKVVSSSGDAPASPGAQPASCTAIQQKCPSLAGADDEGGDSAGNTGNPQGDVDGG